MAEIKRATAAASAAANKLHQYAKRKKAAAQWRGVSLAVAGVIE